MDNDSDISTKELFADLLSDEDQLGFGEQIKAIRSLCGLTQEKLAQYLGVTRMTVNSMEQIAKVSELKESMLFRLAYFCSLLPSTEGKNGYRAMLISDFRKTIEDELDSRLKKEKKSKSKQNISKVNSEKGATLLN